MKQEEKMAEVIIVTQHPGALIWLRQIKPELTKVPVLSSATPADVIGKEVYGNLPLHLAALTYRIVAIEFTGKPPRGTEFTVEDMIAAGARLVSYNVRKITEE